MPWKKTNLSRMRGRIGMLNVGVWWFVWRFGGLAVRRLLATAGLLAMATVLFELNSPVGVEDPIDKDIHLSTSIQGWTGRVWGSKT